MKFLIVGLGNIGHEYTLTRHNIGFLVVDQLVDDFNQSFQQERYAYHAKCKYKGKILHFIKPTTYMNLSGKALNYWINTLKIPIQNVLIITDDIALPFGKLRLRSKGSSGGHNGLKSTEGALKSNEYPRLKFGIGNNYSMGKQADYVLSNFNKEELDLLPEKIKKACEITLSFCTIGVKLTMDQFN